MCHNTHNKLLSKNRCKPVLGQKVVCKYNTSSKHVHVHCTCLGNNCVYQQVVVVCLVHPKIYITPLSLTTHSLFLLLRDNTTIISPWSLSLTSFCHFCFSSRSHPDHSVDSLTDCPAFKMLIQRCAFSAGHAVETSGGPGYIQYVSHVMGTEHCYCIQILQCETGVLPQAPETLNWILSWSSKPPQLYLL